MTYLVTIKPLDKFFFGSENSFNEVNQSDRDRRATYLLKSRYYPQQTSLLGMVRNQLLIQNNLLIDNAKPIKDKAKALELIGPHGFVLGHEKPYGAISKISACYLTCANGTKWLPGPLDDLHDKDLKLLADKGDYLLEGYKDKYGKSQILQQVGSKVSIPLDDAFLPTERVGITKSARPWKVAPAGDSTPEEDEAGYYYQTFMRFNGKPTNDAKPDRFAFQLELNQNVTFKSGVVEMGGERSSFFMKVQPIDALTELPDVQYLKTKVNESGLKHLVCLSPAKVDLAVLRAHAALLCTETITFRFLQSTVHGTDDYQRLSSIPNAAGKTSLTESSLHTMLDRGSVVHFTGSERTNIENLFNQTDLQNIGYNQYCII